MTSVNPTPKVNRSVRLLKLAKRDLLQGPLNSASVSAAIEKIDKALGALRVPTSSTPAKPQGALRKPRVPSGLSRSPKGALLLSTLGTGRLTIDGDSSNEIADKLKQLHPDECWPLGTVAAMLTALARQGILRSERNDGSSVLWFKN